ncbi:MAG: hypothetical protein AB8G86_09790 [Saprospiraceae bacterium]
MNLRYTLLICCLFTFFSCSNEFELNAPAKEIPIVYGVLSRSDDTHYIRVEKAFIDENTSALELAQDPDALYFEEVQVELVRENNGEAFLLDRVDASQLGLAREGGIFATTPNILYKIEAEELNLQEAETYRLNIRRAADNVLTTAITPIVGDVRLNRPIPGDQKPPLRVVADDELTIVWAADETAKLFDVTMIINYEELNPNDANSVVLKSLAWSLAKSVKSIDGPNRVEPEGIEFYQFLNGNITVDPALQRVLKHIDLRIDAGGEELFNYINVGQANTGITSAQVIPNYTNLSSGLGIFASRNTLIESGFVLDAQTKQELRDNDLTKDLNFR